MPVLVVSLLSSVGHVVEDVGLVGCRESQQPLRPKPPPSVGYGHVGKLDVSGRVLGQAKWPLEENLSLVSLPEMLTLCR